MSVVYDKKFLDEVTVSMREGEDFVRRFFERHDYREVKMWLDGYADDLRQSKSVKEGMTAMLCCAALLRGLREHVKKELKSPAADRDGAESEPALIRGEQAGGEGQEHRTRKARKPAKPRVRFPKGLIDDFSRMPELRHNPRPDLPFDICRSEVVNWLVGTAMAHPVFRRAVFDSAYRAGLIVYDRERKTWKGCAHGTGYEN